MKRIAIFASGSGSNAQRILEYFNDKKELLQISIILANKSDAYVLQRAKNFNIPTFIFNSKELKDTSLVFDKLKEFKIDYIILAGFLLKVPDAILKEYSNKIINIHPALLPKYGGKGMYGMHVHTAVIEAGEKESGITIHYVNEHYDEGQIIFQAKCTINSTDTPETLAQKIHSLEYEYFPVIIERLIKQL